MNYFNPFAVHEEQAGSKKTKFFLGSSDAPTDHACKGCERIILRTLLQTSSLDRFPVPLLQITASYLPLEGHMPLFAAVQAKEVGTVAEIITHYASPNCTNKDGDTPLHIAARLRHLTLGKVLLHHGADVKIKNKKGQTPLDVAKEVRFNNLLIEVLQAADDTYKPEPPIERPKPVSKWGIVEPFKGDDYYELDAYYR